MLSLADKRVANDADYLPTNPLCSPFFPLTCFTVMATAYQTTHYIFYLLQDTPCS